MISPCMIRQNCKFVNLNIFQFAPPKEITSRRRGRFGLGCVGFELCAVCRSRAGASRSRRDRGCWGRRRVIPTAAADLVVARRIVALRNEIAGSDPRFLWRRYWRCRRRRRRGVCIPTRRRRGSHGLRSTTYSGSNSNYLTFVEILGKFSAFYGANLDDRIPI